ncbi:Phosphatidylserine decarboxylase proenzyme 2 precursor [Cavenderia fasciculata]|uniref:Phosphatidylserine decarboxylase proenzyme 2 n=1 Tax=Cavenderia fasciculata TaxID=261658 RepID=F4QBH3_CACFS|nr:Phosphatidylserine decarboxylase proenzyme 2 precursor [Cavenderia fasciculata]EGG14945.1 Phosphatidylserine decarboxylase proenzyme 2 precursor [Cavenderia fasciculata]|eukprot:XP_004351461.1 Phosphatidylserine decarboxylase proenzyme 2 precursor [Cavenderia fasciculata]
MDIHDPIIGILSISIAEARGLPKMDLNGFADPFVSVTFGGNKIHKTATIKKSLSPSWNEQFNVIIRESQSNYTMTFTVWDWDKATQNDLIGNVEIEIANILKSQQQQQQQQDSWYNIIKKEKERGELHLTFKVVTHQEVNTAFWSSICRHFSHMDNEELNITDFTALITSVDETFPEPDINLLFEAADTNRDGSIQLNELENFFTNTSTGEDLSNRLLSGNPNLIWDVYAISDSYSTIADNILHYKSSGSLKSLPGHEPNRKVKVILVHNRETGKLEEEKVPHYIEVALRVMYATSSGRSAVNKQQVKKLLKYLTAKTGRKYNSPESIKEIAPFIKFHNLNIDEILDPIITFHNFNEFFIRKLKTSARPIFEPMNPKICVSPADCRMNVYSSIDIAKQLWIKGKGFNLVSLLQNEQLAEQYQGGSLVIARLSPQDYHRFHSPVDGIAGPTTPIDGNYFTVNPVAVNQEDIDVYTENKRAYTIVQSEEFGQVIFIAVGATMVGSINVSVAENQKVQKGDEFGWFSFGGSTILLLFAPNTIEFDKDLLVNSNKPIETYIKVGDSIGKSLKN